MEPPPGAPRSLRIACFGAPGSFSEEAALVFAQRVGLAAEPLGRRLARDVLAALESGAAERAVLPIANSSSGLVRASLEALAGSDLQWLDQVALPVRFSLWGRPGAQLGEVRAIASHPLALRQCAAQLGRLVPERRELEANDTASAARALAAGEFAPGTAVLASARAGARYGLDCLAADVHDEPDNRTYFVVLARPPRAETRDVGALRAHIQALDSELIRLLGRRFEEVRALGALKAAAGLPIVDLTREAELRALYREEARRAALDPEFVLALFTQVLTRSRQEQAAPGGPSDPAP
jgi:prephenate dehydratase